MCYKSLFQDVYPFFTGLSTFFKENCLTHLTVPLSRLDVKHPNNPATVDQSNQLYLFEKYICNNLAKI